MNNNNDSHVSTKIYQEHLKLHNSDLEPQSQQMFVLARIAKRIFQFSEEIKV